LLFSVDISGVSVKSICIVPLLSSSRRANLVWWYQYCYCKMNWPLQFSSVYCQGSGRAGCTLGYDPLEGYCNLCL